MGTLHDPIAARMLQLVQELPRKGWLWRRWHVIGPMFQMAHGTYLGLLVEHGLVEQRDVLIRLTAAGRTMVREAPPLPPS